jgi:hypothetical protein
MSLTNLRCTPLHLSTAVLAVILFVHCAHSSTGRVRQEPVLASGADDVKLRNMMLALSPATIREDEVQKIAACAYTTGRDLKREWQVVWPPGVQNFLVNTGRRKGGLCFQFATVLLLRLDALKLQTLELHWAESFPRTGSEHNVIVVTAKGQPFAQGVLLDNWRYGGNLCYGPVAADPQYRWKENSGEAARRLKTRSISPM